MNATKPLRVVLIGFGVAGSVFHAPLITSTDGLELSAIVTANEERRAKASSQYPDALLLKDVAAVFANREHYDIVVIAAPNEQHAPLAKTALGFGLHTVIDKPMAVSVAEAEELLSYAQRSEAVLTVFQNRRWDNDFLTIRHLLSQKAIGKVIRFESHFERWRPVVNKSAWREQTDTSLGGGLLFDLGSHLIDQALVLFGEPDHVYCEREKRREGAVTDDDTFIAIKFKCGTIAHLWVNSLSAIRAPRFRILGLEGSYQKWGLDPQEDALRKGERPVASDWGKEPEERWGELVTDYNGNPIETRLESHRGNYLAFYQAFEQSVRTGCPPPVAPADAVKTMRVIDAALKSSESKIPATI